MFFVFPQVWIASAVSAAALQFGSIDPPVDVKYQDLSGALGTIDWPNIIIVDKRTESEWSEVKAKCTIVHEYAHLTGRKHSDNPRSIMYPRYRYRVCSRWLRRHGVQ